MNKKSTIIVLLLYFSLLSLSDLWGIHIHHAHFPNSDEFLLVAIHYNSTNCEHNGNHCLGHCKKESFLEHIFEKGAILKKSQKNKQKNQKKSVQFYICSIINTISFIHSLTPFITSSDNPITLYLLFLQTPRAPPNNSFKVI